MKITVRNDGPPGLEGETIALLDEGGSHNRSGFRSSCEAAELPAPKPKA